MNRTLALFLTLAVLLAHALAIHKGTNDVLAPPYDEAHVAYRVARNLVETGRLAWDQGAPAVESYPSLLWVLVAAIGEQFRLGVTTFCQGVGAASVVLTIFVLAQFSPGRMAGVIAPLLFVVCGGIAASAFSGTETASFSLFLVAAFLSYERGAKWAFAICLCLCVAIRAEGVGFALLVLMLELGARASGRRVGRDSMLRAFLPAAVLLIVHALLRHAWYGTWVSPYTMSLLRFEPERGLDGARYLLDFVRASGWTVLLAYPLYYLVRGKLTGVGRRAMLLALGYAALVAAQGGGRGPMFQPLVPMIPILLIAIQESMTLALDSPRRLWPQVTWAMFLIGLSTAAIASKYPGDLGPLPVERIHRAWMQPSAPAGLSYAGPLGRLGLVEEIDVTERLRGLGVFMRRQLDAQNSVLTPWPGAIGYLSRLRVIDARGRTSIAPQPRGEAGVAPSAAMPLPWIGSPRTDVVELLAQRPDYVVPAINWRGTPPRWPEVSQGWQEYIDVDPFGEARKLEVREAFRAYELITVPVPIRAGDPRRGTTRPFHLLRRRAMNLQPRLEVERRGDRFAISVRHRAHEQLVDLRVQWVDRNGNVFTSDPTGRTVAGSATLMRTSILLFASGDRRIELAQGTIPASIGATELRAQLRNPLAHGDHPYAQVSEEVVLPLAP